ncbi:high-potential iron-sulfur protein [Pseudomarimonas salicorniae]|uniref:High-potential iron-sulfur protein n=1 Tax=Pseudomarimonas salicorniae TaxID=2933270 RepID=A0ABT0GLK0_9GAMM|nr:high-potential iron-sulfur protein [Lysobacter sp. CAU 1642]MCK7595414.1 high-potential iron-sulfur protein [Lysobacter sp. CAU 1642]
MNRSDSQSRRRFLVGAAAVAASLPMVIRELGRPALAQDKDLPKLPLDNAQAKALAYIEDASKSTHPNFKPGSNCANCQFIQGPDGAAWRPCQLFPGYNVASDGWCSAWAKKA